MLVVDLDRLASGQALEIVGQVIGAWHHRAANEHRYDANLALQSRSGLEPDEVMRVVEPASTRGVGGGDPFIANHHDQHPARADCVFDRLDKIEPGFYPLDIHEHLVCAEMACKAVVQATGITGRIVASITDEDAVHGVSVSSLAPRRAAHRPARLA